MCVCVLCACLLISGGVSRSFDLDFNGIAKVDFIAARKAKQGHGFRSSQQQKGLQDDLTCLDKSILGFEMILNVYIYIYIYT